GAVKEIMEDRQESGDDQRYRLIVDAIVDYAIYMVDLNGVVQTWNTGAGRLKGYSAEEIVGQSFSRFFTKEDLANGVPERALREAEREGRFETEGWRLRKDGSRFWALAVLDAVRDESGQTIGFVKVTRDLT